MEFKINLGFMSMRLNSFEKIIDHVMLQHGLDYFNNGHVEKLIEVDHGRVEIEVVGSNDYTVDVLLNEHETIIDTHCDYPYDRGEYCKHQVVAHYALGK